MKRSLSTFAAFFTYTLNKASSRIFNIFSSKKTPDEEMGLILPLAPSLPAKKKPTFEAYTGVQKREILRASMFNYRTRRMLPVVAGLIKVLAFHLGYAAGALSAYELHHIMTQSNNSYEHFINDTIDIAKFSSLNNTDVSTNTTIHRDRRAAGGILPFIGKFAGWTVVWTTASIAGSATAAIVTDRLQTERARGDLARRAFSCRTNNVGCFNGYCWTNCGPRLSEADWCFTRKPIEPQTESTTSTTTTTTTTTTMAPPTNSTIRVVYHSPDDMQCTSPADCDPCAPCSTDCFIEENGRLIQQQQSKN